MQSYLDVLTSTILFSDFNLQEIVLVLKCLRTKLLTFSPKEAVFSQGSSINSIGILLSGTAQIQKNDVDGNTIIVSELSSGDIFAEAFLCAGITVIPVGVWADTACEVLFIEYKSIISPCGKTCDYHLRLIENLLKLMANKLIGMSKKLDIVQKHTLKEKIIALLESYDKNGSTKPITLPFNRNELADYLGVNRSALSRELGNLKNDGIIDFKNNIFTLKQ